MGIPTRSRSSKKGSTGKDHKQVQQNKKRHLVLQQFACKLCPKRFNNLRNLRQHQVVHTGEKPFGCIFCGKMFGFRSNLNMHLIMHTKERPYDCRFCGKAFSGQGNMKCHLTTHTGEKRFKCELCEKSFSTSVIRNRHIRMHTLEKPYKCEICSRRFAHRSSYKMHQYRLHDASSGRHLHNCIFCDKEIFGKQAYMSHIGSHISERPYTCRFCSRNFLRNSDRINHERRYCKKGYMLEVPRTFGCVFCVKKFQTKVLLENHLRIHTGEKPFECTTCHKWFNQYSNLHRHSRTHSGAKPYECGFCKKRFSDRGNCKRHVRQRHRK